MIKEETFFIKEILRYGYGGRGVLKYFVNKFLNSKKVYSLQLPACRSVENFEIHMLCRRKDADMLAWSLISFINQGGICPKVIVHDDGSFDKVTAEKLEHKFPNLTVLLLKEANKLIEGITGLSPKLLTHRERGHKLIHKLVDIFLLSNSEKVMILDSDVLFFSYPKEIIEFISGNIRYDSLISKHDGTYELKLTEAYLNKYNILASGADYMNSGIILYDKNKISADKLLEYFENTLRKPGDYFVEMTGWGCLIAQTKFSFLPPEKYHIKGRLSQNSVAKHFTSPRRHEFYIYGIDIVKSKITN